jgi:hypothetical protein
VIYYYKASDPTRNVMMTMNMIIITTTIITSTAITFTTILPTTMTTKYSMMPISGE